MTATALPQYATVRTAAARTRIPGPQLVQLLEAEGVELLQVGKRVLIPEDELLRVLRKHRRPTAGERAGRWDLIGKMAEERATERERRRGVR